jgi:hypothetical protein
MRPQRLRYFVGCEGASERSYVKWIQDLAERRGLLIHLDTFVANGGDPLSIVEQSIKTMHRRQRVSGLYRSRFIFLDSDRIGETPNRDVKLRNLAQEANVSCVFQEWEHEALLLRHFDGYSTRKPPAGKSMQALKRVWKDYTKPADAQDLARLFDENALERIAVVEVKMSEFLAVLGFIQD